MMADTNKDTIYIDIDDEITSVIDKVRTSKHKILALVLPKRATVFQSIVNMKLLKRTADETKKHIVLITSEAVVLPLAGAVGLHVAKTLQSKPAIPTAPELPADDLSLDEPEEEEDATDEPELDGKKSIGELAGMGAGVTVTPKEETIDLNDEPEDSLKAVKPSKKYKKNKKLAVPNFEKFRKRLLLIGGALILLIILWIFAFYLLPKATITIKTNTSTQNSTISFTADTGTKSLDTSTNMVPAEVKSVKEIGTQTVPATGQQNNGSKASGTVTVSTICTTHPASVSAGITLSSNGSVFVTTDQLQFGNPTTDKNGNFVCSGDVPVSAQSGGSKYNFPANSSFSVSGYPNMSAVNGAAFTGGTDQIVTIVSQADIDGAKQKLAANTNQATTDLTKALRADNMFPLNPTLLSGTPVVTTSVSVGAQASQVTVTEVIPYTMLGVKQADLDTIIKNVANKHIDTSKQTVVDTGLSQATFQLTSKQSADTQTLSLQTSISTGAKIDQAALKKQISGKKKGDVQQYIGGLPGVQSVTVNYSPFWVSKVPGRASRVIITLEKASGNGNTN